MMKFLLLLALLPLTVFGQAKKKLDKPVTVSNSKADGFRINGILTGFTDGANVDLLNGNNGAPEASTKLLNGKFSFTGKTASPEFKLIAVNGQPPYITLFLDNSTVTVQAAAGKMESAIVKGSSSHNDFAKYTTLTKPYESLFGNQQQGTPDPALPAKAMKTLEKFIQENPGSYITPLAIFRYNQLSTDAEIMEKMYDALTPDVKSSPIGSYIAQQVSENKKNPLGKPLADFSQADTAGNIVKLSSLRGKYVLVDFWASWCGPCRQENPNLVNMYNKFKDKNFTVLGVSLDKSKDPWMNAIKADALTWTHVSDLQGWNNAVAQQFQIFSIPQNFLLDPNGNVIAKNLRGPALDYKLSSILK